MTPVDKESARWFAALRRGVMSQDERDAYRAWICEPENAAAIADLQSLWDMLGSDSAVSASLAGKTDMATTEKVDQQSAPLRLTRLAVTLSAASLAIAMLSSQLNSSWWTTLDWWSR